MGLTFTLRGLLFVLTGAAFWLGYFYLMDRFQPEPRQLLVATFLLGVLAAGLALGVFEGLYLLGVDLPRVEDGFLPIFGFCVLGIGLIEEGCKFLLAALVVFRWKDFDQRIDGIVYAATLAVGFATLENLLYLPYLEPWEQAARFVSSPVTHALFSVIWGYGFARARFVEMSRRRAGLWIGGTLLLSALLHGLYDFFLLAAQATLFSGILAAGVWAALIVHARRQIRVNRALSR